MTDTGSKPGEVVALKPCPFCDRPLYVKRGKINPAARCVTEDCFGAKMPVVNTDVPSDVAAWNIRASAPSPALREALINVRAIIAEAALTGFNWKDGDWAERLFASQQMTSAALQAAGNAGERT